MYYPIPGNVNLFISDKCVLNDRSKKFCKAYDPTNMIEIELYGKPQRVAAGWLMRVAMLGIDFPDNVVNVKFYPVQGARKPVCAQTMFYKPKYYRDDFRIVPDYPSVAVTNDGKTVIDIKSGKTRKICVSRAGYSTVSIWYSPLVKSIFVSVHRLVASAWVFNPLPGFNTVVNHLDGKKTNNYYLNLEWTTHLGNNLHAINSGFRTEAKKCYLRHADTGEILEFPSISRARQYLGLGPREAISIASLKANRLYNGYELRIEGDKRPWVYVDQHINREPSRYIITVTDPLGEQQVFNGTRTFLKHFKLWNVGSGITFLARKFKQQYKGYKLQIKDQQPPTILEVKDLCTGEIREFSSQRAAEAALGICKAQIVVAAQYGGRKPLGHYVVRYKTSDDWPTDLMENKCNAVGLTVLDKNTHTTVQYPSLTTVAAALNKTRGTIKRMIAHPKPTDKYEIKQNA